MTNHSHSSRSSPPSRGTRIPWIQILTRQGVLTPEMLSHAYAGSGTPDDPSIVTFLPDHDPRDSMHFPLWLRWTLCLAAGWVTFSVAFISSAYAGGVPSMSADLGVSPESATLGLSLFLLGFVLGPFFWAPCSELFGRQIVLLSTGTVHVALNIAACFGRTLPVLLILRLLSGATGAATLTNSGAVIADIFAPKDRGLAITVYALVPLFAPVVGPMVGAYVSTTYGWRWSMAVMAAMSSSAMLVAALLLPETYAPVLLEKRARRLSALTGKVYISAAAVSAGGGNKNSLSSSLAIALSRPFRLALNEPIISLLALYQAVVFGTLYLSFTAFPIIWSDLLGYPAEQSGLAFLGVLVGILFSVFFAIWDNNRYVKRVEKLYGMPAPPELRLPACCVGGIAIVAGLLSFAWTATAKTHWIVHTASGVPFGFGIVLVTISTTNYLVDSYTIYAASALTVCICGRAVCGAVFPLFVRSLFASVGVWWGLLIPTFLSLICLPFPFWFLRYGPAIRARGKYAAYAAMVVQQLAKPPARGIVADENTPLLED
ncbi:major facilitator superfamily domain-containing protein [Rhypophila decipiens]|uniref:Major facilitator superfamily domain-containing protein n=1 Tax=Rhypophila decipiens TaxID=261697 RepID=A0AAN6YAG7_9PEZI|nr:major facilitator superfamily domain-containing protein [Rhypophila decipiens]